MGSCAEPSAGAGQHDRADLRIGLRRDEALEDRHRLELAGRFFVRFRHVVLWLLSRPQRGFDLRLEVTEFRYRHSLTSNL